jgi:PhnB protein
MSITPHIVVQGAERAVAFYRDAFAAEEVSRIPVPDGRLMSVQLRIGDGLLHIADEFPEMQVLAPPAIGGTPVVLALDVADAEAVFAQAVTAGRRDPSTACEHVLGRPARAARGPVRASLEHRSAPPRRATR